MVQGVKPLETSGGAGDRLQKSNGHTYSTTWPGPREASTSAKYLEVDISGSLSWGADIDRIVKNTNRSLGFICRNIKRRCSMSEKRHTTPWSDDSWSALQLCGPYHHHFIFTYLDLYITIYFFIKIKKNLI